MYLVNFNPLEKNELKKHDSHITLKIDAQVNNELIFSKGFKINQGYERCHNTVYPRILSIEIITFLDIVTFYQLMEIVIKSRIYCITFFLKDLTEILIIMLLTRYVLLISVIPQFFIDLCVAYIQWTLSQFFASALCSI